MGLPPSPDGVDVYFEMPGDDSEHANFLRAKMDLEERRMKRINEVSFRAKRLLGIWVEVSCFHPESPESGSYRLGHILPSQRSWYSGRSQGS